VELSAEIQAVFKELMFGSGAWIGFLIIIIGAVVLYTLTTFSAIIATGFMFFLGLLYFENVTAIDNMFMWGGVLCFMTGTFMLVGMATSDRR